MVWAARCPSTAATGPSGPEFGHDGAVRHAHREDPLDALFVHTQVPAVLLGRWMRRIPTVVSLDATPLQYDELGHVYSHGVGPPRIEQAKHALNVRCLSCGAPARDVVDVGKGRARRWLWRRP